MPWEEIAGTGYDPRSAGGHAEGAGKLKEGAIRYTPRRPMKLLRTNLSSALEDLHPLGFGTAHNIAPRRGILACRYGGDGSRDLRLLWMGIFGSIGCRQRAETHARIGFSY